MLEFKKVETDDELLESFRLRFQVYCKEKNYLSDIYYPDAFEKDEYDENYSVHFVAVVDSEVVGTVRLILSSPYRFPVEKHYNVDVSQMDMKREYTAEISRLIVKRDKGSLAGQSRATIIWGILRCLYHESLKRGIEHWVAAMENSLWRLLSKSGIPFKQVGLPIEYQGGLCFPFAKDVTEFEKDLFSQNYDLFKYFEIPQYDYAVDF